MNEEQQLQFRLSRFDTQIRLEFDLISHRMTWLMSTHAFLFGAFAFSVTAAAPRILLAVKWLEFMIPIIGMTTALLVALATGAAHRVVERLKQPREALEQKACALGYERLGVGVESPDHLFGNFPSRFLPWILLIVWSILMAVSVWTLS